MALYGKVLSDDAGNNGEGEKEEEEPDLPTIMAGRFCLM